ncbi:hypothetical protein EYF80_061718 [Liparis tanakae]|uniref:Uncharacterized protein n=1 Tax=Liparis tanakae TaxID=230148 RepID=A0A4Z2EIF3_9TELE|nr:hypothetical protein EYF80_061718 [Liparis tanakae]
MASPLTPLAPAGVSEGTCGSWKAGSGPSAPDGQGSGGALVGRGGRVDGDGDGGRRRHCGDGLAIRRGVGPVVRRVVIGRRVVGGAGSVARRVFPVAAGAAVGPGLGGGFESVHARAGGWGGLPGQLALGVPAAVAAGASGCLAERRCLDPARLPSSVLAALPLLAWRWYCCSSARFCISWLTPDAVVLELYSESDESEAAPEVVVAAVARWGRTEKRTT